MAKTKKKKAAKRMPKPKYVPADVGKPGRKHRTPLAVAYSDSASVVVALMHPANDTLKLHKAGGLYEALGRFRDEGYDFGTVKEDVPPWVLDRIPKGCTAIGAASITTFPIV